MVSLLSFGEVLVDFLPQTLGASSYAPLAGGAPANVAVGFAKLGGASFFAGGISTDNFGAMLLDQLNNYGVDTSYVNKVADANTALVLVSLDKSGERDFNFYRQDSADMYFDSSHIDKINWQQLGIFHYCSNTLTDEKIYRNTLYALKSAKAANVVISFDVNLRQQLWSDLTLLPNRVDACIKESDMVKLSKDEALYLAKIKQLELQDYVDELIAQGVRLVVITDGANAVQINSADYSLMVEVPSIQAVDTTAAGDSFISGVLFSLAQQVSVTNTLLDIFSNQEAVLAAVEFASQCGAYTCQNKGAFDALPKFSDL